MSDTILATDLTVFYLDETRRKQIIWTGGSLKTDVQKMIDVYSATEDLFTVPTQQNDGLIFSAETPGEYTIGTIDAGELEPWFIDLETMEHIIGDFANFTGCALKTSGWARTLPGDGTDNIGIVVAPVDSGGAIVKGDIGNTIAHAAADAGTLLDVVITGGATDYLFIRPDTNLLADDFNSTSGNLTANSNISVQNAAAITGEMIWGNVFSQGALVSDTHLYVLQNGVKITANDQTDNDWWPDGHIDRAIPITDYTTADFPLIDLGFLTVKANKYSSKYTNAVIRMNSASGGNVSAGLSSGADGTNTTGYNAVIFDGTGFAAGWSVGDEMEGVSSGARGIITLITSPGASQTVHYYLVGDPLTNFTSAGESVTNADDSGTGTTTVAAPSLQGPALTTWFDGNAIPTYAFANTQVDIDDDGNDEEYGITIDLLSASLAQMHEANKYTHARGSVIDQDGIDGEQWIGLDYAISYSSITGTVSEGATVTGATSLAEGIVVSNPAGATNVALLRNSRGSFIDGEAIEVDGSNRFDASGLTVEVIVPVAEASFGTLAGTSFFFSRGVVPVNYKVAEENLFSVIDAGGTPRSRPTSITMTILNLLQYDYATCHRLEGSGLAIDKDEYSATGGETLGGATLTVDGTIAADVPGKTLGGHLVYHDVADAADGQEYVIRYDSYIAATGVVTLSNYGFTGADSASSTNIQETGAFSSAVVGDLVYNIDEGEVSYISEVVSANEVNIDPPISGQTTGNDFDFNVIPVATVDTADNVAFLIVFEFKESDGTASASMQYVGDIFTRVVVRNTGAAAIKIKGNTQAITIGTGGGNASAGRIENTVYVP